MKNVLGGIALSLSLAIFSSCVMADVTYSYTTNSVNPMVPSGPTLYKDWFQLQFTVGDYLAPSTLYEFGTTAPSIGSALSWTATDFHSGIELSGGSVNIALSPNHGALDGSGTAFPSECTGLTTCFGGAFATDSAGRIAQWNMSMSSTYAGPFVTFITTYSPLGSWDVFATHALFEENEIGGSPGYWGSTTTAIPAEPVSTIPEPSTLLLLLAALPLLWKLSRPNLSKLTVVQ